MLILLRTNFYIGVTVLIFLSQPSFGDYDCLCSNEVESAVFSEPDTFHTPIGYMYKYDCKPLSTPQRTTNGYFRLQFEHNVAYMSSGVQNMLQVKTCAGTIPNDDKVTTAATTTSSSTTPLGVPVSTFMSTTTLGVPISTSSSTTPLGVPTSTSSSTTPLGVPTKISSPTTVFMTSETTVHSTTHLSKSTTEAPITWPTGTYGLMEAAQGCPDDGYVTWSEGWRYQETEGAIPFVSGNEYTFGIESYMKGEYATNNIKTYFCMKTRHVSNAYDRDWPRGSYCILKYGHCPEGFRSGSVFWDDVVIGNHDDKGGVLPEGTFNTETEIFYCCRGDGPVGTSIVLPTTKPFILLRYTETCQRVTEMSAYDIFIHWDDQNFFNSDRVTGMHPYDDGDRKNHKLHFCYYSSSSGSGTGPGLVGR